jgi:LysR family transcriptional regulator for bpeEF and oprC
LFPSVTNQPALGALGIPIDKLRAITFFCRTVEAKSFAAAARSLDVVPSALSKVIAALERELHFTLFHRSTRRLSLTEEGGAYYDSCRLLLQGLEEAESVARAGPGMLRGTLRIGIHPAFRVGVISGMREFLNNHPELTVEMITTNAPTAVLDGLDLVLRIGEPADSGLRALRIGWTEHCVCASPAYIRLRGEPRTPHELTQHHAVIYGRPDEDPCTEWEFVCRDERVRVTVPVRLVVRDGNGLVEAAIEGCGVARPWKIAIDNHIAAGKLTLLLPDWSSTQEPIFIILPSSRGIPAKVRAFVDFAQELFSK